MLRVCALSITLGERAFTHTRREKNIEQKMQLPFPLKNEPVVSAELCKLLQNFECDAQLSPRLDLDAQVHT